MNGASLALLALALMVIGPMPQKGETIIAQLCDGGQIEIPVGNGDEVPMRDCHQKACHAGTCRQKAKQFV